MLGPNQRLLADALRSGRFRQGRERLTRIEDGGDSDCCLGVACKVAVESGVRMATRRDADLRCVFYDGEYLCLPEAAKDFFGFRDACGAYGRELNARDTLTSANDADMRTFADIAGIIEDNAGTMFSEAR